MLKKNRAEEVKEQLIASKGLTSSDIDISISQDMFFALANLISMEEHLIYTAQKENDTKYFEIAQAIRKIRGKYLNKLVQNHSGEVYCYMKHSLASYMRLIEIATKCDNDEEMKETINDAYNILKTFWLVQRIGGESE